MATGTVRTPRQTFDEMIRASVSGDWEAFIALYPDEAVIEMPFAPPGVPRVSDGVSMRERIIGMLSGGRPYNFERAENVTVHETTDPEVIVIECDHRGRFIPTGRTFDVPSVQILQVRDGLIVSARDFTNHAVIAAAAGQLPAVLAALDPQQENNG